MSDHGGTASEGGWVICGPTLGDADELAELFGMPDDAWEWCSTCEHIAKEGP